MRNDVYGTLPIKSSVICSNLSLSSFVPRSQNCPSSRLVVRSMMRLESMLSLVNLFANLDTDNPNNSIAVFANVQTSVLVNSHAASEFIIFPAALETISILLILM